MGVAVAYSCFRYAASNVLYNSTSSSSVKSLVMLCKWSKSETHLPAQSLLSSPKLLVAAWQILCYYCPLQAHLVSDNVVGWSVLENTVFRDLGSSSWGTFVSVIIIIIIIIYSLTVRVLWAPRMISKPVSSIFPVLHCPLGLCKLQACPFPDVVFPPLPLSALSSSPFHCALQDGFGQTWWNGDTTIPLQFASLYDGQVFVWSNCLLDLGMDLLVGNMVFVWDA